MGKRQDAKKTDHTINERFYKTLDEVAGIGKISRFIETLIGPHVLEDYLERSYREMVLDEVSENEANDWIESTIADIDFV